MYELRVVESCNDANLSMCNCVAGRVFVCSNQRGNYERLISRLIFWG